LMLRAPGLERGGGVVKPSILVVVDIISTRLARTAHSEKTLALDKVSNVQRRPSALQ
jgi:hypothetical protein